jgi:MFS family permease
MCSRLAFLKNDYVLLAPYIGLMIHSFVIISLFVFVSATQAFLLIYTYRINPATVGVKIGLLSIADEVTSIFMLAFWGAFSDRFGRLAVLILGYLITTLALFVIPLGTDWEVHLVLTRILFAIGTSALSGVLAASKFYFYSFDYTTKRF